MCEHPNTAITYELVDTGIMKGGQILKGRRSRLDDAKTGGS
jgi:hypothetical protein